MGLNLLGIFSALKSFRLYTASTGGKMKQRVEKSHSRSAKSNIQAMAQAASMKQKRRASGNGQDFRSRSFDNLMAKRKEVEEALIRLSDSKENTKICAL
jgi:hypothetical protein